MLEMRASVAAENRKAAPGVPVLQEPVLERGEKVVIEHIGWAIVITAVLFHASLASAEIKPTVSRKIIRQENPKCVNLIFQSTQSTPTYSVPGFSFVGVRSINGNIAGSGYEAFSCVRKGTRWNVLSCPTVTGMSVTIPGGLNERRP